MQTKNRETGSRGSPRQGSGPWEEGPRMLLGMGKGPLVGRARLRVLVVDNEPDNADSMALLVRLWGHDVRVGRGGAESLLLAFAFQHDAVLLDIGMPGVNGYDVARRLREEACFEDTLLIAVTGYADEGHRLLGAASGLDHYLVKPVQPSVIQRLLEIEQDRLAGSPGKGPRAEVRRSDITAVVNRS